MKRKVQIIFRTGWLTAWALSTAQSGLTPTQQKNASIPLAFISLSALPPALTLVDLPDKLSNLFKEFAYAIYRLKQFL